MILHNKKKKEYLWTGSWGEQYNVHRLLYAYVCGENQWNSQHCSTITNFHTCVNARDTTKGFYFHICPLFSLVFKFWNSVIQEIPLFTQRDVKCLLLHRTALFQQIRLRGRLNSLLSLGSECRTLVHTYIHDLWKKLPWWFCRNTW